ncbi:hypothetical protein [Corynebacterium glyciniphilum]|uniref:hypothetical protein n=1 Tax=Corynebacterium glyciniphilum TaxID=1404244 RepID=UPI00264EA08B|nr:hypothetical protein [Corynebacterium glyciniphilum]MDN6706363.1 hypothetical protein [Corynebacterium glyciniphilum]
MADLDGTAATMIVGILSTLGLILVARVKAGSDRDNAKGPDWDNFSARMQAWTKDQLADRDAKIETLQSDVRKLEGDLRDERQKRREIEGELSSERQKRQALVGHVMDWRQAHRDQSTWPRLPPILHDDLAT